MDDESEDDPASKSWQIGVFFGFLTSCVAALSKLTIRKSWLMIENLPESSAIISQQQLLASKTMRWAGILGMSVLNPVFDLLAMNYANPSLLSSFSGLALAWIVLLSGQLIGEPPQRIQVLASGLIGLGLILTMAFGDHTDNDDVTLEDVVGCFQIEDDVNAACCSRARLVLSLTTASFVSRPFLVGILCGHAGVAVWNLVLHQHFDKCLGGTICMGRGRRIHYRDAVLSKRRSNRPEPVKRQATVEAPVNVLYFDCSRNHLCRDWTCHFDSMYEKIRCYVQQCHEFR